MKKPSESIFEKAKFDESVIRLLAKGSLLYEGVSCLYTGTCIVEFTFIAKIWIWLSNASQWWFKIYKKKIILNEN